MAMREQRTMRRMRMVGTLVLALFTAAGCGGGTKEDHLPGPDPNATPGPVGDAAIIEFVVPADQDSSGVQFEPAIGPIGSANPQSSLIAFRVLNGEGRPARDGIRVVFSLEGPADATLTALEDETKDGFVRTIVRTGSEPGNVTVVARVKNSSLVARSAAVVIGRPRGAAAAIEFFGLRVPGLIGNADDNAGTPQTRTQLGIRGSGFNQAVDVVFAVLDAGGVAALDNTAVDFRLFGPNGGETISPTSAVSNDGFVSATVLTGDRPGPVQVEARIRGTQIVARAIPLTIGSGLNPTATHLSLAAQCLNVAGRVTFGLENDIRAGLSDQFNNPIPLGSAVSFFTEGGGIQAQGITDDGFAASAKLVTQLPIPADGRVTILAVTTGQEAFTDTNGNARFDVGEPFVDQPNEVFLDANEDGAWQPGEFFIDNNNNGVYDAAPNGVWDDQILISTTGDLVFSGHAAVTINPTTFALTEDAPQQCFTITVADDLGNPLVGGTTVTLTASDGATVSPAEFTIPDTNADTRQGPVPGATQFTACVTRQAQPQPSPGASPGPAPQERQVSLTVEVESSGSGTECPGGNGNASVTISGTVQ
jgi:hypothetical protein